MTERVDCNKKIKVRFATICIKSVATMNGVFCEGWLSPHVAKLIMCDYIDFLPLEMFCLR